MLLSITDPLLEDALDWMPKYLEKGIILWIGVALEEHVRAEEIFRLFLEMMIAALDSRIIKTDVISGESNPHKTTPKKDAQGQVDRRISPSISGQ